MTSKENCASLYVPACEVADIPLLFFAQQVLYFDS